MNFQLLTALQHGHVTKILVLGKQNVFMTVVQSYGHKITICNVPDDFQMASDKQMGEARFS